VAATDYISNNFGVDSSSCLPLTVQAHIQTDTYTDIQSQRYHGSPYPHTSATASVG